MQIAFSLGWGQLFLNIPQVRSKYDECDPPRYGFYFYGEGQFWPDTFVICRGRKTKHIELPWCLNWIRTSKLATDQTWMHETRKNRIEWYKSATEDLIWKGTYPYTYVLKNGTVQNRTATVTVEEREWRPRWFKWTTLFAHIRRSIWIEFDAEVGERTGSWKGGTLGCGWELKPGQTPEEALREMEEQRKM